MSKLFDVISNVAVGDKLVVKAGAECWRSYGS